MALSIFDSKEVEMIDQPAAAGIFVDDGKCRTRHRGGASNSSRQTLDELGLAAAELAFQRQNGPGAQRFCELTAKLLGLSRAI